MAGVPTPWEWVSSHRDTPSWPRVASWEESFNVAAGGRASDRDKAQPEGLGSGQVTTDPGKQRRVNHNFSWERPILEMWKRKVLGALKVQEQEHVVAALGWLRATRALWTVPRSKGYEEERRA